MTTPSTTTSYHHNGGILSFLWRFLILQQFLWFLMLLAHHQDPSDVVRVLSNSPTTHSPNEEAAPHPAKPDLPSHWDSNKPSLIFHIGPSKTGTTSIQKESLAFTQALQDDRHVYLGRYASPKVREPAKIGALLYKDPCFQQASDDYTHNRTHDFLETKCWKKRMEGLEEYRKNGTSIVLSDEAYSYNLFYMEKWDQHHFEMLRVAFQDWNVLIVPTYRRYFEWILSVGKERNSKHCLHVNAPWPAQKERNPNPCDNLWATVENQVRRPHDYRGVNYGNLDVTIPAWHSGGFDTKVLNFHSERHITCSFYCDIVPDTPHTCQQCLEGGTAGGKFNSNSASMTAYNDIVYQAAQRGLISVEQQQKTTIYNLTQELAQQHQLTGGGFNSLPLKCPSEAKLTKLLDKSLAFEKLVFPDWAETMVDQHTDIFWERINDYCAVDTEPLLKAKTSWEQVVEALATTETNNKWPVQYV